MTNPPLKCILFDIDGVLLDSLPQHLQICRDLARRYDLALEIPSAPQMRRQISAGLIVSPMRQLFLAVGFPPGFADQAVSEYQREFAVRYRPRLFPGVPEMLMNVHGAGLPMGLVTANIRENVEPALHESMGLFDARCLYFYQSAMADISKAAALTAIVTRLGVAPAECIYVGDQPSDQAAAVAAGCQFLGVAYGWGIMGDEGRFDVVQSVAGLSRDLLRRSIVAL
jgi:phosphoglycolate phosphatase